MTIATAKNTPRNTYTATGGQTVFTIGFEFFATGDIKVFRNGTALTYNAAPSSVAQFSVQGTTNASDSAYEFGAGGTVTLGAGATADDSIVIVRDIVVERTTDFTPAASFDVTALNTQLDTLMAMMAEREESTSRSLRLPLAETTTGFDMQLPVKASRANKILEFDSDGDPACTITSTNLSALGAITTDVTAVAAVASNVTTVAGISSNVTTVAGIASDVTAVSGKSTEISRLGTSDAVADLAILGTSAIVTDMDLLGTSANVAAMGHLGTSANVTAMGLLGTSTVVADMALLATSDVIADMALLANADVIADMNTLATSDIVSDLNTLATSDIVADLNTLATSDIVSDINTLATSDIVSDLNTLATSDIVSDINTLATSDVVTDLNLLATSDFVSDLNTLATSSNVANIATVATNVAGVNSFAARYRVTSGDPGSDNDAGDLNFNTSSNVLKYYNGSAWVEIDSSPSLVTIADESTDTTCFPLFATAATGDIQPKSGSNLTFNSNTGILTATGFAGDITGNVTGNTSGSSGSCTGNAAGLSSTLVVGSGGTGATSLTANGVLIGNGTSAVTAVDLSTKGKLLAGDGSGNPSALTVGTNDYVLTADSSEATGLKWALAAAGATGGGTDQVFYENARVMTTNYTITSSKSASTVGPLTINSGVTLTIPSGERLVIL